MIKKRCPDQVWGKQSRRRQILIRFGRGLTREGNYWSGFEKARPGYATFDQVLGRQGRSMQLLIRFRRGMTRVGNHWTGLGKAMPGKANIYQVLKNQGRVTFLVEKRRISRQKLRYASRKENGSVIKIWSDNGKRHGTVRCCG